MLAAPRLLPGAPVFFEDKALSVVSMEVDGLKAGGSASLSRPRIPFGFRPDGERCSRPVSFPRRQGRLSLSLTS